MNLESFFTNINSEVAQKKAQHWFDFLKQENFDFTFISQINMSTDCPVVTDQKQNKFSIDFENNKTNYHKKKSSIKTEIISKALGAGKLGLRLLDLSAGLGIDSVFLAQLGFEVTAVERNPLVYLCLQNAVLLAPQLSIKFEYANSLNYLKTLNQEFDVIYFDPMFPEKNKSALPRQEMVFFKAMVGADADADQVLQQALQTPNIKRVVVKRPIKAPFLGFKPTGSVEGKLIRFDIYGVQK